MSWHGTGLGATLCWFVLPVSQAEEQRTPGSANTDSSLCAGSCVECVQCVHAGGFIGAGCSNAVAVAHNKQERQHMCTAAMQCTQAPADCCINHAAVPHQLVKLTQAPVQPRVAAGEPGRQGHPGEVGPPGPKGRFQQSAAYTGGATVLLRPLLQHACRLGSTTSSWPPAIASSPQSLACLG